MKNMLLVLLIVILLAANIYGIVFIYHWVSPHLFQEREVATDEAAENAEIASSEPVEVQEENTNGDEDIEFKILDMNGDFVVRYNQTDLHLFTDESLVREQLGEPDQVLDSEIYFNLSEDQPTKITELHYNNNLILHIHEQTSQLIGIIYLGKIDILEADWWNGIRELQIDVEHEFINSKSNRQSLTIDKHDSDLTGIVRFELTPNLQLFTINNSDVYIKEQDTQHELYTQEQNKKIYEDGYLVLKRGDTIYLDSRRFSNGNNFSLAIFPKSLYREGFSHYVRIGSDGQPETVELPETQFTNRMDFSHNIVLSITPNHPDGVIILPGDTVEFDMFISAAPKARIGVYEAIARFEGTMVTYSGRVNYPGFGGFADEIRFKIKVVE